MLAVYVKFCFISCDCFTSTAEIQLFIYNLLNRKLSLMPITVIFLDNYCKKWPITIQFCVLLHFIIFFSFTLTFENSYRLGKLQQ